MLEKCKIISFLSISRIFGRSCCKRRQHKSRRSSCKVQTLQPWLCQRIPAKIGSYQLKIWKGAQNQESPWQTKPKKGPERKVHEFRPFCEFWCFSIGKQARFTLNFCSGMPLGKVHELAFLWFGLPGPLLTKSQKLAKKRLSTSAENLDGGKSALVIGFQSRPILRPQKSCS